MTNKEKALELIGTFASGDSVKAKELLAKDYIQLIYNKTHFVLADGDYALAVSEGSFAGAATTFYDLFRVENGKIAEHWDVMETLADKATWQNQNGKF
jgi:hypothetical protein